MKPPVPCLACGWTSGRSRCEVCRPFTHPCECFCLHHILCAIIGPCYHPLQLHTLPLGRPVALHNSLPVDSSFRSRYLSIRLDPRVDVSMVLLSSSFDQTRSPLLYMRVYARVNLEAIRIISKRSTRSTHLFSRERNEEKRRWNQPTRPEDTHVRADGSRKSRRWRRKCCDGGGKPRSGVSGAWCCGLRQNR